MRLLSLDPLRDSVHATVMRLHAKHGRFGPALRQYNACALALQRDLGVAPAPATRQLYEEILRSGTAGHGGRPRRGADAREPTVSWPPMVRAPHVGRVDEMQKLHEVLKRCARPARASRRGDGRSGYRQDPARERACRRGRAGRSPGVARSCLRERPDPDLRSLGRRDPHERTCSRRCLLGDFSPVWRSELRATRSGAGRVLAERSSASRQSQADLRGGGPAREARDRAPASRADPRGSALGGRAQRASPVLPRSPHRGVAGVDRRRQRAKKRSMRVRPSGGRSTSFGRSACWYPWTWAR